jgi:hypothetical protein
MHLLRARPDMLEHLKSAGMFLETGTARMAAENAIMGIFPRGVS